MHRYIGAMTRHIPLQGVENFRDFGDYAAGAGRLRKGVLFRSAHQAEATDADLETLATLGIVTLVVIATGLKLPVHTQCRSIRVAIAIWMR